MKTTRKILSLLLVLAMVSALFIVGATAEGEGEGAVTPVQVTLIDESGNLEGSKIAPDGKPETATDLVYLSDTTNVGVTASAGIKNDLPYHANTFPYVAPNKNSRKQVDGTSNNADKYYPKINADGSNVTDADGNVVYHEEKGVREVIIQGEIATLYYNKIHLGGYATIYEKGVSTHPNALGKDDRSIIYATNGAEYFYSIVGGCGSNITDPKDNNLTAWVDFEVYGSTAAEYTEEAEFVLLASANKIGDWYTAEFNVNISGYNYIKLLVRMNEENTINKSGTGTNSSCGVTWADACVYNLPDYTVTYDGNGGKTEDDKESVTVELTDVTAAVTAAENTFAYVEAEGSTVTHVFTGWNTVKEGGEATAVAADADITKLADAEGKVTLYAQWKEVAKAHTVTFVIPGQDNTTALVEDGTDATLPSVPAKEGYTVKWSHDGKNITADTTITAEYVINTYTVTIVIPGQDNTTVAVEHGKDVTLPAIPEKSGFTGAWDHDGKAITADTTITASYARTVVSVKPGNKISGLKGASNKTWLSDLYAKDVADAAAHTLVESPKYVVYSYVSGNKTYASRLFSVNVNFFNRAGIYSDKGETYKYITKDTYEANGKTYKNTDIVLGINGTSFEKGLGFQPAGKGSKTPSAVVFDISSLKGDHFYAVVGLTGMANNTEYMVAQDAKKLPQSLTFKVYGSKAESYSENAEFELLASCENLTDAQVGEFNVNIEGYKYLKLVCENNVASSNNEAVWANACVYKADVSANTADGFSMTAVAAAIVAATSVVALVVTRKKFF